MKTLMALILFLLVAPSDGWAQPAGIVLPEGAYEMTFDGDHRSSFTLEVLSGNRFRYWDRGSAVGETFLFEGHFGKIKTLDKKSTQVEFIIETSGLFRGGKVLSPSAGVVDMKLSRLEMVIVKDSRSITAFVDRTYSYYKNPLLRQKTRLVMEQVDKTSRPEFIGLPFISCKSIMN